MKQIKIQTTTDSQLSIQIAITHIEDSVGIRKAEDEIALFIYGETDDCGNNSSLITITKENARFLAFNLLELSYR